MIPINPLSEILGNLSDNFGRYYGYYSFQTVPYDGTGLFSNRRLKRKAWIFSGIISEEYIIGFAIVDAGIVGTSFCYVKERKTGIYIEEKAVIPYGFPDEYQPGLDSPWILKDGKKSWRFQTENDFLKMEYLGEEFSIQFQIKNNLDGISTIAPSQNRPFHFTYKNMNLGVSGILTIGNKDIPIKGNYGVIDFSKGYPPRETFWNWACLIGKSETGDSFGLNLVSHFNEGLENIYWLSGKPNPLDTALFHYQNPIYENYTLLQTTCGSLEIEFYPEGKRQESLNAIFLKSDFTQAFGNFRGSIQKDGIKHKISGQGLLEEHYALW